MNYTRILASFGVFLCSCIAFPSDWPQYRGASVDGKSAEKITATSFREAQARWKVPTAGGFSSFVASEGRAITIVQREVEGVPRDVLLALSSGTGKEQWAVPLGVAKY